MVYAAHHSGLLAVQADDDPASFFAADSHIEVDLLPNEEGCRIAWAASAQRPVYLDGQGRLKVISNLKV